MVSAKTLHWIFSVPVGVTISIIGLFGNIISIIIWKRVIKYKLRGNISTGFYLITLAICDIGLLVFFLLTDSLKTVESIANTYSYAAFFSWFGYPAFFFFLVASVWLVVGVTINRFIMTAFPLKVRELYTRNRTYASISVFIVFSALVNIPHFFNFHPKETNGTYKIADTEYGSSDEAKNYEFWIHCIVLILTPWFMIAVLNGLIIYNLLGQMKKFEIKAKKTHDHGSRERQMTRMLLAVTFSFLVLLAWQCVTQCFYMLRVGENDLSSSRWQTVDLAFAAAKLGVIINSSINWIFYCLSGSLFRKEFLKLLNTTVGRRSSESVKSDKSTGATDFSSVITNTNV